jgi:8-oxo-dGTP pyrophosphatase MutT (NUDIX family)
MAPEATSDAIPAATLIVVREQASGPPELLMVERAEGMAFAAGALVFPGGRIDEADRQLGTALGIEAAAVAAIRETIEETAVPVGLATPPRAEHCLEIQAALAAGQEFAEVAEQAGLTIDAAALTPFARWVPKFHAVRRFDTLFFVAEVPPGEWQPQVIEGECAGAFWVSAQEVLERENAAKRG